MPEEEKLREIKIEQEPTQVTWRRCTQCNAAQMEFQLREDGICQKCYISNLEKENAELRKRIEEYNLCGNTVDKQTYNEVVNENAVLKAELKKLQQHSINIQKICFDSCLK